MKQLIAVIQRKKFQLTLGTTLSFIWLLGPYIAIAGKVPLETLIARSLTSLIALAVLLMIDLFKDSHDIPPFNHPTPSGIDYELQELSRTIKYVLRASYRNAVSAFLNRYKKPWYLVLGPANAGKSTLLIKSELKITKINDSNHSITPKKLFDWWLAEEAVFIDISSQRNHDLKNSQIDSSQLYKQFFSSLKRLRTFKPINGLILTLNLQEITTNIKEHARLNQLTETIQGLYQEFNDFPIYIIITRSDLIEGFSEFFESLGPEERDEAFGFSFPLSLQAHSLPELFNEQYNKLLSRLNERVIWQLHNEHNIDKISKIKNFPLQIESLKDPLAKVLNLLLPNTNVNLRGVFFTSAIQKDTPYDNLTKTLAHTYNIPPRSYQYRTSSSKSFFLSNVFKKIILPEATFYANVGDYRPHLLTSFLIIILSASCIFLFNNSYQSNQLTLRQAAQAILLEAHNKQNDPQLHNLNLLQTTLESLKQDDSHWYSNIGLQQVKKLQTKAKDLYFYLLKTRFSNQLQYSIEEQLENYKEENTNQLYANLKAYLMLANPSRFDKKYFMNWFENYWHQAGRSSTELLSLHKHLDALLQEPLNAKSLNASLIEYTRAILNNMPQSRLVLTILQNQYQRSPVKILPTNALDLFPTLPCEISGIYDIRNFRNVYYAELEKTCREVTSGNWVLGKTAQPAFSDIVLNQLLSEVQAIYLNEYAVTWSDIMAKVKMTDFQNLNQIINTVNVLSMRESPLLQLLHTIKKNTQPISNSIEFTQQVSTRFLNLNALSDDVLTNTNQESLNGIKAYLLKIATADDLDKASYDAAKQRMSNQMGIDPITSLLQQARALPEPLRTWHTTIAAESWRIILRNSQYFINKIWTATVFPQYQALLMNRYPIFKESTVDVTLNDFANFFGNNGIMDLFFKNFLQPFVDNSQLYWEWKNVDGQRINIPQTTLEMFIRAALIQKMFFPDDGKMPSISFSLVPVELDPGLHRFSLDLEGQGVLFARDNEQILSLSWPGPSANHTEASFEDDQGKKVTLTESGPWSWFKLLDKSKLEATANPKHFRLSFGPAGSAAHYELYTNGIVNPFIPGIINVFRCPEHL